MITGGVGGLRTAYNNRPSKNSSPLIDEQMIQFLLTQGFTKEQIVSDVTDLKKADAGEKLKRAGFYYDHFKFGEKTIDNYTLGNAHPGGYGQTAAIISDGSVVLTTFAGALTQTVSMDKDGNITNKYL